jgi:cytidine deaminase
MVSPLYIMNVRTGRRSCGPYIFGARGWCQVLGRASESPVTARVHGTTRVGAAVLSAEGEVFPGCNVEHRFRSHDVHAGVNALTSMVSVGHSRAVAVLIVSDRDRFTPCGGCLDWIFELGGPDCLVGFQSARGVAPKVLRAHELMPHYPR